MTGKPNSISLEPKGQDFVLTRTDADGNQESIMLAENDVLTLAQSAQRLKDHILERRTPKGSGVATGILTAVSRVALNVDIHQTEVLLTLFDRHGAQAAFSLPLAVAKPLSERLPVRVLEIEAAATKRTKQ